MIAGQRTDLTIVCLPAARRDVFKLLCGVRTWQDYVGLRLQSNPTGMFTRNRPFGCNTKRLQCVRALNAKNISSDVVGVRATR